MRRGSGGRAGGAARFAWDGDKEASWGRRTPLAGGIVNRWTVCSSCSAPNLVACVKCALCGFELRDEEEDAFSLSDNESEGYESVSESSEGAPPLSSWAMAYKDGDEIQETKDGTVSKEVEEPVRLRLDAFVSRLFLRHAFDSWVAKAQESGVAEKQIGKAKLCQVLEKLLMPHEVGAQFRAKLRALRKLEENRTKLGRVQGTLRRCACNKNRALQAQAFRRLCCHGITCKARERVLRKTARHLLRRRKMRSWEQWKHHVHQVRRLESAVVAMRHINRKRAWQTWQTWTVEHRCHARVCATLGRVLASRRSQNLRDKCFRAWKRLAKAQSMHFRQKAKHESTCMRRALSFWSKEVSLRRRIRHRLKTLARRCSEKTLPHLNLSHAWRLWSDYVSQERKLDRLRYSILSRFCKRCSTARARRILRGWCKWARVRRFQRRGIAKALSSQSGVVVRRAFTRLLVHAQVRCAEERVWEAVAVKRATSFCSRQRRSTLSMTWEGWKLLLQAQRETVSRVVDTMYRVRLEQAFSRWMMAFRSSRLRTVARCLAIGEQSSRVCRAQAFERWKRVSRERGLRKRVLERWVRRARFELLRIGMDALKHENAASQARHFKLKGVAVRLVNRRAAVAFSTWRRRVIEDENLKRRVLWRCVASWQNQASAALWRWKFASTMMRSQDTFQLARARFLSRVFVPRLETLRLIALAHAWRQWLFVELSHQRKCVVLRVVKNSVLVRAWRQWTCLVSRCRAAARCTDVWRRGTVTACFRHWQTRTRLLSSVSQTIVTWQGESIQRERRAAFGRWMRATLLARNEATLEYTQVAISQLLSSQRRKGPVHVAFVQWKLTAMHAIRIREQRVRLTWARVVQALVVRARIGVQRTKAGLLFGSISLRQRDRKQHLAFLQWRVYALEHRARVDAKNVERLALQEKRASRELGMAKWFGRWRTAASVSLAARRGGLGVQLRNMRLNSFWGLLSASFDRWKDFARERQALRHATKRSLSCLMQRCFGRWDTWTKSQKLLRRLVRRCSRQQLRVSVQKWRHRARKLETVERVSRFKEHINKARLMLGQSRVELSVRVLENLGRRTNSLRLQHGMRTWRRRVCSQTTLLRTIAHWRRARLRSSWQTWIRFLKTVKLLNRVARFWKTFQLRQGWQVLKAALLCSGAKNSRALTHRLGSLLIRWKTWLNRQKRLRVLLGRCVLREKRLTVRRWQGLVALDRLKALMRFHTRVEKRRLGLLRHGFVSLRLAHGLACFAESMRSKRLALALQKWRSKARRRKIARTALRRVLGQWRAKSQLTSFLKWKLQSVGFQARSRRLRHTVALRWHVRASRRFFQKWKNKARISKTIAHMREKRESVSRDRALQTWISFTCRQRQLRRAVARHRKTLLAVAIQQWSHVVQARVASGVSTSRRHEAVARAFRRHQQRLSSKAWARWKAQVQVSAKLKRALQSWSRRKQGEQQQMVARAFFAWQFAGAVSAWRTKSQVSATRALLRRWRSIATHEAQSALRRGFERWQRTTRESVAILIVARRWTFATQHQAFSKWKSVLQAHRYLAALLQRACTHECRREGEMKQTAFRRLARAAFARHGQRTRLVRVVQRMKAQRLSRAFASWASFATHRQTVRQIFTRILSRRMRSQKRLMFYTWSKRAQAHQMWVRQIRSAFRCLNRWHAARLSAYFGHWRKVAHSVSNSAKRVMHVWRHQQTWHAFNVFKKHAATKRQHLVAFRCFNRWRMLHLGVCFRKWRVVVECVLASVQRIVRMWQTQQLRRAFATLRHRARVVGVVRHAGARWKSKLASRSFARWSRNVQQAKLIRSQVRVVVNRLREARCQKLTAGFERWRIVISTITRASRRILHVFLHATKLKALRRWQQYTLESRRIATAITAAMQIGSRMSHNRLHWAWTTWKAATNSCRAEQFGARVLSRWWNRMHALSTRRALRLWQRVVISEPQVVELVLRKWALRRQRAAFGKLEQHARKRTALERMARHERRARIASMHAAFSTWWEVSMCKGHAYRLVRAVVTRWKIAGLRKAWALWKTTLGRHRVISKLAMMSGRRAARDAFRVWSRRTHRAGIAEARIRATFARFTIGGDAVLSGRARRQGLRRAWACLVSQADRNATVESLGRWLVNRKSRQALWNIFDAWRRETQAIKIAKRQELHRAWAGWKYASARQHFKERLGNVQEHFGSELCLLRHWAAFRLRTVRVVTARRALAQGRGVWHRSLLAGFFSQWRLATLQGIAARKRLRREVAAGGLRDVREKAHQHLLQLQVSRRHMGNPE